MSDKSSLDVLIWNGVYLCMCVCGGWTKIVFANQYYRQTCTDNINIINHNIKYKFECQSDWLHHQTNPSQRWCEPHLCPIIFRSGSACHMNGLVALQSISSQFSTPMVDMFIATYRALDKFCTETRPGKWKA